jgi:hypothetical protein
MYLLSEAKSVRERYIRVAEIVIMTTEGSWNICMAKGYENIHCVATAKNVRGLMDLLSEEFVQSSILHGHKKKTEILFRFRIMNTCDVTR